MAINHEMNYYNYGKTLSAEGVVESWLLNKKDNHEYVDLGLSVKWATCNIGASSPEETGLYFAWGETSGYTAHYVKKLRYYVPDGKDFTWDDYTTKFGTYDENASPDYGFTKYNTNGPEILDAEDDAAVVNWGDGWRMPTKEEFDELLENTNSAFTVQNGVSGLLLTSTVEGYTDKFLFFPAVGYADNGQVYSIGANGNYWSASLGSEDVNSACGLNFSGGYCGVYDDNRYYGYAVRPVFSQDL